MNWKRIQRSKFFESLISRIAAFFMRFAFFTTKWTFINYGIPLKYINSDRPLLVAMWHDRLMTAPCAWTFSKPLHVLASAHRDGALIANIVRYFGMIPVFGSTGKCSTKTAERIVNICKGGGCMAIIPDGPRGPRHEISPGIITIAKRSQSDILIFSSCVKRFRKCDSWDKFILAYPFNRGAIVLDVLTYDEIKSIDAAETAKILKSRLDAASKKAESVISK